MLCTVTGFSCRSCFFEFIVIGFPMVFIEFPKTVFVNVTVKMIYIRLMSMFYDCIFSHDIN